MRIAAGVSLEYRPRRAALGLADRRRQRAAKLSFSSGPRSPRSAACGRATPGTAARRRIPRATMRSSCTHSGLSVHSGTAPRWLTLRTLQLRRRHHHLLIGARGAVIGAERPVDQQHVEPEEAEHRPGAHQQEHHAGGEAHAADTSMKIRKPVGPSERCGVSTAENIAGSAGAPGCRSLLSLVVMAVDYTGNDGETKTTSRTRPRSRSGEASRKALARKGKAAPRQAPEGASQGRRRKPPGRNAAGRPPRSRKRSAACRGQSGAARRACTCQSLYAAGRGGAVGAGDRRRRQQGDAGSVRGRRHAGKDGGARRGQACAT